MKTPSTLAETIALFGNPALPDGSLNTAWQDANIVSLSVPPGYPLYYDGKPVRSIRIHRLLREDLRAILNQIWQKARVLVKEERGYSYSTVWYDNRTREKLAELGLDEFSGSYVFRKVRKGRSLSNHAFGIAIDLDAAHNRQGTEGRMPMWVVEIFASHGWQWGGRWHAQPGRCNYAPDSTLPLPLKSEKALWLADAIPWTRFGGQHSGIADELEALAFGCDLARGTGAEMIVNEHDDPQQIEPESRVFEKARLLVDHGVHPAFIDATYEQILARRAMYNAIASYCAAAPDMNPVTDAPWVYGPLLQAFAQWKALGGGKSKSVPVRWSFAGHGPDNE